MGFLTFGSSPLPSQDREFHKKASANNLLASALLPSRMFTNHQFSPFFSLFTSPPELHQFSLSPTSHSYKHSSSGNSIYTSLPLPLQQPLQATVVLFFFLFFFFFHFPYSSVFLYYYYCIIIFNISTPKYIQTYTHILLMIIYMLVLFSYFKLNG